MPPTRPHPADLAPGLKLHCSQCGIVIPADAPDPGGAECAWVAENKMACYKPGETVQRQHIMATAAWHMIFHRTIRTHAASREYLQLFKYAPEQHFAASVASRPPPKPPDIHP